MATIDTRYDLSTLDGPDQERSGSARPLPDPARQAYLILLTAFVVAPVVFGLDKVPNLLVHWDQYLAPVVADRLPVGR